MIKTNQNPVSGNVTWTVPNTVPFATYTLRAFVYRNVTQANGMNISQPVATGVSVGYFQVRAARSLCETCSCRRSTRHCLTQASCCSRRMYCRLMRE